MSFASGLPSSVPHVRMALQDRQEFVLINSLDGADSGGRWLRSHAL